MYRGIRIRRASARRYAAGRRRLPPPPLYLTSAQEVDPAGLVRNDRSPAARVKPDVTRVSGRQHGVNDHSCRQIENVEFPVRQRTDVDLRVISGNGDIERISRLWCAYCVLGNPRPVEAQAPNEQLAARDMGGEQEGAITRDRQVPDAR